MGTTRTAAQRRRARALRQSTRQHEATAAEADLARRVEEVWDGPETEEMVVPAPRWPAVAGLAVTVLGVAVASYLTWVHYHPGLTLACPETGIVDCAAVTTSSYSSILGIPVALMGLVYFVGMLPFQLPVAWRSPLRPVRWARLAGAVAGIGMVLWLVYAELFLIGKICIYCTSVHVLTFVLFVVTLLGTIATTPEPVAADQVV